MSLRLEPVTPANVEAACRLELRPGQERFVGPVAWSLAEALAHGEVAWPRLVTDDGAVVGFVMAFLDIEWDPEAAPGLVRSGIWRLNVAAGAQGRGVGRYAVEAVCAEVVRRGGDTAYVTWKPGEDGPAAFWARMGFAVVPDEDADGEVVGRRHLARTGG